jgi:hypothetical protein
MMDEKITRHNLLASMVLWTMSSFNFYLVTFYLKYFPGDIFQSTLCFAFSDLFGYIFSGLLLKKVKVGRALRLSFLISGFGAFFYIIYGQAQPNLLPFLICMTRVGCTMNYNILEISVPRLFPIRYVATVYGYVLFLAHIFACLSPMIAEIQDPYPFTVFFLAVIISLFCSYFLVEMDPICLDDDDNLDLFGVQALEDCRAKSDENDVWIARRSFTSSRHSASFNSFSAKS